MKLIIKLFIVFMILVSISCSGSRGGVKLTKREADKNNSAKLNVQMAAGYIQRGQLKIAQQKLQKALQQNDEYVPAYTTMAVLMEIIGKKDEAESYYLEALDIDPSNPELRNNYGTFLCKQDKIEQAVEQFRGALDDQFYETPEKAHANIGYCLLRNNQPDYKEIEMHLRQALEVQPNMSPALIAMGELGVKTKRYLLARAFMQRYHAVARPTATSLWYQIQAEKALGDEEHFVKLSKLLLKHFADSPESKKLMKLPR